MAEPEKKPDEKKNEKAPEKAAEKPEEKDKPVPVELGDPQVFAKVTPEGRLIAVKAKVTLKETEGHLTEIQGKVSISSLGYHRLNQFAGLSLVGPRQILLPHGEAVPNPYVMVDEKSGYIRAVVVRRIAVGLSPIGVLSVVDRTLHYDLRTYLLQEIVKKVSRNPAAGSFLHEDEVKALQEQKGYKGWPLALHPPVYVWVDLSNKEVIEVLETHTQRMRFAERIATSICERNALRSHPSIAVSQVVPAGVKPNRFTTVTVFGFRHDLNRQEVERLSIALSEDQEDKLKAEAAALGLKVEKEVAAITAGEEDVAAAAPEVNGDEAAVDEEKAPATPAKAPEEIAGDREAALKKVMEARKALGDEKLFFKLMAEAKISTTLREAPTEALQALGRTVASEVDKRAQGKK